MLKSPVYMKKPKPQKLLSRVKGGVGLICSSVHTVEKKQEKATLHLSFALVHRSRAPVRPCKRQSHRRAYGSPLWAWMGTKTRLWEEIFGRDTEDKKADPMAGATPKVKPTYNNWLL